jgi:hypothetical protein
MGGSAETSVFGEGVFKDYRLAQSQREALGPDAVDLLITPGKLGDERPYS